MAHRAGGRRQTVASRHPTPPSSVPIASAARERNDNAATLSAQNAASPSTARDDGEGETSQPKRVRQERGLNWSPEEVLLLIQAKRDLYLEELEAADPRHVMNSDTSKWQRVAADLQLAGYSAFPRDFQACRTKWNQIYLDYKKIADFFGSTCRDVPEFWLMSAAAKKAENLPRQYPRSFFDAIHEWNGSRPVIQPPHSRDLLSPVDSNYRAPTPAPQEDQGDSHESDSDPYGAQPVPAEEPADTTVGRHGGRPPRSTSDPPPMPKQGCPYPDAETSRHFRCIPPGALIHNVSSSAMASSADMRRKGSTTVRRKNIAGHTVITEATIATGAVMASQMQGIADTSLAVERSKMEVQVRLFKDQITYQRKRDHRTHVSAAATHENERLSKVKQGELVSCLAQLTDVLARSLTGGASRNVRRDGDSDRHPPAVPKPPLPCDDHAVGVGPPLQHTQPSHAACHDGLHAPARVDSNLM